MTQMGIIKASSRDCETDRLRSSNIAATVGLCLTIATLIWYVSITKVCANNVNVPTTFADLVQKVKPAVVSIRVSSKSINRSIQNEGRRAPPTPFPDLPRDHPLNEFFRNLPRGGQSGPAPRKRRAQGSGFIVSADGYVVTNNHVIRGGDQITVTFDDDVKYDAELIGTDARTDLALLKIKSNKPFEFVKFATKQSRVGDWVVAVGNPFGLGGTVTAGILSAQGRDIGSSPYDFIQVDAAVNRGNSGGPTFNLKGEVIGVNTAIYSPSGGNVGIAFAVPAATVVEIVDQLKKNGSVQRGWLGVRIQTISEDIASSLGLNEQYGALVSDATVGGPAEKAGLRSGDAILQVNGKKIVDSRDLARKIAEFAPNTIVKIAIRRAGEQNLTMNVKLGTFPGSKVANGQNDTKQGDKSATLTNLGLELSERRRGSEGVRIVDVDPDSDAAEKGVRRGDIILQVNSKNIQTLADVDKIVVAAKKRRAKALLMTLQRGDSKLFVGLKLKKVD
ncbi:MAG: Periplasmic serine endoprotease DegP [Hyphomicrobiaceae bacterium hypho_1]